MIVGRVVTQRYGKAEGSDGACRAGSGPGEESVTNPVPAEQGTRQEFSGIHGSSPSGRGNLVAGTEVW